MECLQTSSITTRVYGIIFSWTLPSPFASLGIQVARERESERERERARERESERERERKGGERERERKREEKVVCERGRE
jgi:hypothetical protein